jgi:hypothetical protein
MASLARGESEVSDKEATRAKKTTGEIMKKL